MNPPSSRHLVADYINYRLTKHGHTWENCPPLDDQLSDVQTTLRAVGDTFEEAYRPEFEDMVNQLHISQNTAYPTFNQVVQELFSDGVKWGRIVALFGFAGVISVDCVDKGMPQLVDSIVDWVSTYIDNNLNQWITMNNGWDGFVEWYDRNPSADKNGSPWDIKGVVKMGVIAGIGAMAIGAILNRT